MVIDARRLMGGLGLVVLTVLAIAVGSPLGVFLDVPTAVLVFAGGAAAWLGMTGRALPEMWATLQAEQPSASALSAGIETARAGRRAVWLVAAVSVLIGFVQLLQSLDDPNAIGPALAVSLLPLFYAFIPDLLVVSPIEQQLKLKRVELLEDAPAVRALDEDLAASRAALDELKRRAARHQQTER